MVRIYNIVIDCFPYTHSYELYLWNPITESHFHLLCAEFPSKVKSEAVFGFGYDSSNDDYKIVRVTDFIKDDSKMRETIRSSL